MDFQLTYLLVFYIMVSPKSLLANEIFPEVLLPIVFSKMQGLQVKFSFSFHFATDKALIKPQLFFIVKPHQPASLIYLMDYQKRIMLNQSGGD